MLSSHWEWKREEESDLKREMGGGGEKFLSTSRAQEKYTRIVLNEIECLENVQLNKVRFESATYSARLIRRPNGLLSDLKINRQVLRDGKIL